MEIQRTRISIDALGMFLRVKNRKLHKMLSMPLTPKENSATCCVSLLVFGSFQMSNAAMPMRMNMMVHAGPKIHFGGWRAIFGSWSYHGPTSASMLPMNATRNTDVTTMRVLFHAKFFCMREGVSDEVL